MSRFLGFDSRTKSLAAVIVDTDTGRIIYRRRMDYDEALPHYNTRRGILPSADPLVQQTDPCMWADGLDMLLELMRQDGVDFAAISGIAGSAQPHGSVCLNHRFLAEGIQPGSDGLGAAVRPLLTRQVSPVWSDLSTFDECRMINQLLGGAENVQRLTGSPATERFAAAQIRKFARLSPADYESTAVIHPASSFMASLLVGASAPTAITDASATNLFDIVRRCWAPEMLEATAPGLAAKLPALMESGAVCGTIADYFQHRYGFHAGTPVLAWCGSTMDGLVGMGALKSGTMVASLGTIDTCSCIMKAPAFDPRGYGHVFVGADGSCQALICFQNGGAARDAVRRRYNMSWQDFDDRAFQVTPAGNNGNMMLPYYFPECTPLILNARPLLDGTPLFVGGDDGVGTVRALVEAQAISMRNHSDWACPKIKLLRLTGASSRSREIAQVYADVFGVRVERHSIPDAPALGAALRCAHAINGASYSALSKTFCACDESLTVEPIPDNVALYTKMREKYRQLEKSMAD